MKSLDYSARRQRFTRQHRAAALVFAPRIFPGPLPRTGAGVNSTPNFYGGTASVSASGSTLDNGNFYSPSGVPGSSTDVLLDSKQVALSIGSISSTLAMESLSVTSNSAKTGYTITDNGTTNATLTLGGTQGFTNPNSGTVDDLIYVTGAAAGGNNLTITGTGTSAGTTLGLALASNGNFDVAGTSTNPSILTISAPVSGAFSVNKTGSGNLFLNAANTFSGTFTTTAGAALGGTTSLGANGALGSVSAVTVNAGTTLTVSTTGLTNVINDAAAVSLKGTGVLNLAGGTETIGSITGTTISSLVIGDSGTAAGGLTVGNDNTSTAFSGVISGTHAATDPVLTKIGTSTLILNGANTFTGGVAINSGILALGGAETVANGSTPASGPLGVGGTISFGGGMLRFSSANTFDYSSRFSTGAAQAYSIDTAGQNVTFSTGLTGTGAGSALTKMGDGILTLVGASTYKGGTTVSGGSLQISNTTGSATGGGLVNVNVSGTLLGTGTINAGVNTVNIRGTLSPGAGVGSAGTINMAFTGSGALTLAANSTLAFDITSTTNQDLVALSGTSTLNLNGGTLALNLPSTASNGIDYTAKYPLFTGVTTLTLATPNMPFSSVTGYDTTDYTALLALNGSEYDLSFAPVAVPEPSTVTTGALLLAFAVWNRRRRLRARLAA